MILSVFSAYIFVEVLFMIKKMLSVIICLSMLVGLSVCVFAQAEGSNASSVEADVGENNSSENSLVKAKAAILIDADSGTVLYRLNENKKLPLASVTKIMTMLLVMEAIRDGKLRYEDKIACSKYAQKMGGSQIWMEEGEQFSVLELLKATECICIIDITEDRKKVTVSKTKTMSNTIASLKLNTNP